VTCRSSYQDTAILTILASDPLVPERNPVIVRMILRQSMRSVASNNNAAVHLSVDQTN